MKLKNKINGFIIGLIMMIISSLLLLTIIIIGSFIVHPIFGLVVTALIMLGIGFVIVSNTKI